MHISFCTNSRRTPRWRAKSAVLRQGMGEERQARSVEKLLVPNEMVR